MGTADRDYFRDEQRRYAGGGRQPLPPVTKFLLIANIAIFLFDWLFMNQAIARWAGFSVATTFAQGRVWELLSFQFIQPSPGHVLFDSIGLYFFGPWIERWLGARRFMAFFLLCGVGGALFFVLLGALGIVPGGALVGISAGIYGCLVGTAVIDPKAQLQLIFPPVIMAVRKFALIYLGIAFVFVAGGLLVPGPNGGGAAGLFGGGAIVGFLLARFPFLLGKPSAAEEKIVRPKEFRRKPRQKSKLRPRTSVDIHTASEVDRILDKINKEGLQSLTAEEQKVLNEAGKSRNDR
ncbi:rhomboid family intramembrane serine protease [Luteolibacter sp. Populi]|uniref:rhomboid family intramembrane serine protease n=1 Tax=Luteolibacter sp. Populi TaxID=3230487 RepID=UPI0034663434